MNTPEQNRSIASRVVETLKRIPDQAGHFVKHTGGDFDWGHESSVGPDSGVPDKEPKSLLEQAKSFHLIRGIEEVLNSRHAQNRLGIGMLVITYIAIHKIER